MSTADLVLKKGTIIDGTGRPRFRGDVAIRRNRIAAVDVAGSLTGVDEIDCSGLTVAPGFIDTHSHSDLRVLTEPQLPMKVRQGITRCVLQRNGTIMPEAPHRGADDCIWGAAKHHREQVMAEHLWRN